MIGDLLEKYERYIAVIVGPLALISLGPGCFPDPVRSGSCEREIH